MDELRLLYSIRHPIRQSSRILLRSSAVAQAAISLGRHRPAVLWGVVLPQLLPALLAGGMLVVLHVIADFGVVSLMRYDTLSAALYASYNAYDLDGAARIALLLVGLAGCFLVLELLILGNVRFDRVGAGTARIRPLSRLGFWQLPALLLSLSVFATGVALPLLTIGIWMSRLSDASIWSRVGQALWCSLSASLPAAACATLLAVPIAILGVRYPSPLSRFLVRTPWIGYSVPPLAFALSLIMLCTAEWVPDAVFERLYQSLPLLVFAYTVHFLAEAVGPIGSSLRMASPRLEDAARCLGHGRCATFFLVTLPLIRRGALVAFILLFLSVMKELPLAMLLSPTGFQTLAQAAWDHAENAEFARAAPYALTILLTSGGLIGLLLLEGRRSR